MAENKFRRYLNGDDEQSSRFSLAKTAEGIVKTAAVAGAAVGAFYGIKRLDSDGVIDIAGSLQGIRKASGYLEGYLGGVNKTVKSAGLMNTILGNAKEELEINLKKSMAPAVTGSMRPLDGYATKVESFLDSLSRNRSAIAESALRDARKREVMKDVIAPEAMMKDLDEILNYKNSAALRSGFRKQDAGKEFTKENNPMNLSVEHATKQLKLREKYASNPQQKAQFDSALASLKGRLQDNARTPFLDKVKSNKSMEDAITKQIEAFQIATARSHIADTKKTTLIQRALTADKTGMKQVTVQDLVNAEINGTPLLNVGLPNREVVVPGHINKKGPYANNKLNRIPIDRNKQLLNYTEWLKKKDAKLYDEFMQSVADPLVFKKIGANGTTLHDFRYISRVKDKTLKTLSNNLQVPFLGIRPFKLLSVFNREAMESMPKFYSFGRGTVMPMINNSTKALEKDYFYSSGRLLTYNTQTQSVDIVRDNVFLASAKFGAFQRTNAAMSGISKKKLSEPNNVWDRVKQILDIGNQEYESDIKRSASVLTKFFDVDWGRNIWYNVSSTTRDSGIDSDYLKSVFPKILNTVDNNSTSLDRATLEALSSYLTKVRGVDRDLFESILNEPKSEGSINAIYKLLRSAEQGDIKLAHEREFKNIVRRYTENPQDFEKVTRTIRRGGNYWVPESAQAIQPGTTELLTSFNEAEKLLHMELLHQAQSAQSKLVTVGDMVQDLSRQGRLTERQGENIKNLWTLNELKTKIGPDGKVTDEGIEQFAGMVQFPVGNDQKQIKTHLQYVMEKANPFMGYGPGEAPENVFKGNEYILLGRSINPIKAINDTIKRGGNVSDVMKTIAETTIGQLGLGPSSIRAGRGNLDKVTTATHASYYYLFRLNEGISKLGIGLSYANMGSTQDIAKNLFLRRIAAPLGAMAGLGYLNYQIGNLNGGENPNQTLAKTYAGMTLDVQRFKDITGINYYQQYLQRILPGSEKLYENPLGMAVKYGTFGLLGDNRGYDELKHFYEKGYSPMRKGRFWGIGSTTPFYGGRIEYWEPSWYRQTMGQPSMTDAMYGSEAEYWNPMSWINPNHWVNKHRNDRPYPTWGGLGLEGVPIIGPALEGTIGRVINPVRRNPDLSRAHREYLTEINQRYTDFIDTADSGATIMITPGGRITPVRNTGEMSSDEVEGGIPGGVPGVGGIGGVATPKGYIQMVDGTQGFGPGSGNVINNMALTQINQSWVAKSNLKPIDGRSIQLLRDHTYVDSISEALDPDSPAYRLSETWYSMTEVGGIYGFMAETMFGDMTPRTILQDASRMTSLQRRFWDQNLGGLGGELSEIYRRFIPSRRKSIKEYNPLNNQMPSWMPGLDYFIDFKHGDPYMKVSKGEMRLPGPGYEAINKLHPDMFGRYGALDRFKILADVAPWSTQYAYYNKVVSRMNQAQMISEEDYEDVQRIREMVSERKQKYDLHPYKFKYADIEKKTVTVERMIDANTFLTKEFPGQPIRLAGVKVSDAQTPEGEEQRAALAKYVAPGMRVKIGLDSDPMSRVRDDVMGTMHAVVYDKWGDSVQKKLANSNLGIKANYKDTSATTTHALYSSGDITVGKMWEWFSHLDTPIHTKFLQIRSPLEMYERQLVYGKEWQSWKHPIRDWIAPTVDRIAVNNPIMGAAVGAGVGWLFGTLGHSKGWGSLIGAAIGGGASTIRTVGELTNRTIGMNADSTWVPGRRKIERDIEEYFDILKYVKYKGLYEKTRRMARFYEGMDPEDIMKASERRSNVTKAERTRLEGMKRWLRIAQSDSTQVDRQEAEQAIKLINSRLNDVSSGTIAINAGPLTMRALQYRQEYLSTLYGADPYGDLLNIYKALPKKERPFFKHFMTASPSERDKILRIVPENQRRFFQAKWGMKVDGIPDIGEYFKTHYLPDENWEGWKPGVSLEEVKLKFVNKEALEIGEFGFWEDDLQYARSAPDLPSIQAIPNLDVGKLKKVLHGMGIENGDVIVQREWTDKPENLFNVKMDFLHDRTQDVLDGINDNISALMAEF